MDRRFCACAVIAVLSVTLLLGTHPLLQDFTSFQIPTLTASSITTPKSPRVFCMILTMSKSFDTKTLAVQSTWAQRCTGHAFFYTKTNDTKTIPDGIPLKIPDGREHLTAKSLEAIKISFERYNDSVDWFLKADDDTYVIMENLKHMLSKHDPNKGIYVGGTSHAHLPTGYNGGGAGYALSKEAAKLVVERREESGCARDGGYEDLEIGRCLAKFGVYPVNTRDDQKKRTFHPDHPLKVMQGQGIHPKVYTYSKGNATFGNKQGDRVLSPDTVSFHHLEPAHMYMYDSVSAV